MGLDMDMDLDDFEVMEKWNKRKPNNQFLTDVDYASISEMLMSLRVQARSLDRKNSFSDPKSYEKLGKILAWLFKYPDILTNEGVWMDPSGFVSLQEVVALPQLRNQWTEQDVQHFIETQEEETYLLGQDGGQVFIKAVAHKYEQKKRTKNKKKKVTKKAVEQVQMYGGPVLVRVKPPELESKFLNSKLSGALRHGAERMKLQMDDYGYVELAALLNHRKFAAKWKPNFQWFVGGWGEEDVRTLLKGWGRERYDLKTDGDSGKVFIRAFHGHSIKVSKAYTELRGPSNENLVAVRGLRKTDKWEDVKEKGLSRNKGMESKEKCHMWFRPEDPSQQYVSESGRHVFIYVDVGKAMKDGFKFFRADNNYLGTPGNEGGFLPPKYFKKVVDFHTGEELEFERD